MAAPGVIKPGMRVSLLVSDQPDPVDATVGSVYLDEIGQEVATYTRTDGKPGIQCTRFLTAADAVSCDVCGDPGRAVTSDGYALCEDDAGTEAAR